MQQRRSSFEAIGTLWDIRVYDKVSEDEWFELMQKLYLRIQAFDKSYSRFRSDSLVTRIADTPGRHELPADGHKLLTFYEQLYSLTDGRVTPLIGQTMNEAGYDADYSFKKGTLTAPPKWEDVLRYDKDSLTVRETVWLDFGAAGKGYLVDIVSELIEQSGVSTYTINAGGDILHRSEKNEPLRAGLENPLNTSEVIGVIELGNKSLCASSGSKRTWESLHHIIDPTRLSSPVEVLATWVIADDTMTADGLATALFFTSPEKLRKHFNFSFVLLDKNMSVRHSDDFPIQLFVAEPS